MENTSVILTAGFEKYEVVKRTENVVNKGYKHTDGLTDVKGQLNEIVLKKK